MLLFYLHNLDDVIRRVPLQLNPIGSIRFEIRFKPNSANRKIIFGTRIVQASGGYVNPMKRLLPADENGLPLPKRLSLTLKRPATHVQKPPQGFGPVTSEEDFRCDAKGVIPLYPKSSNKWALYNLMKSRNRDEKVPENLLPCPDAASGYVSLCKRCKNRMANNIHLPQSAVSLSERDARQQAVFLPSFWIQFCCSYNVHSI